jgi:hypothetical protein
MASLPLDVQQVLNRQVGKAVRVDFEKKVKQDFAAIKNQLINEFLNHPVTKEIKNGPTASNISNTLNGVSNLFAFIGFEDGDDPIAPIINILQSVEITFVGEIPMGCKFSINMPTPQDIFAVTPMPWASGRSWAQGVEKGISGLGYLLRRKSSKSRSGEAIQSSVKIRGGSFKNTQYVSALINKYSKKFSQLK